MMDVWCKGVDVQLGGTGNGGALIGLVENSIKAMNKEKKWKKVAIKACKMARHLKHQKADSLLKQLNISAAVTVAEESCMVTKPIDILSFFPRDNSDANRSTSPLLKRLIAANNKNLRKEAGGYSQKRTYL
jgi:hypothetical protein